MATSLADTPIIPFLCVLRGVILKHSRSGTSQHMLFSHSITGRHTAANRRILFPTRRLSCLDNA